MAISSGVAPHFAFINGVPILQGTVEQKATRKSSEFNCTVAMSSPGAKSLRGGSSASVTVQNVAGGGTLITGTIDVSEFDYVKREIVVRGRDNSAKLHNMKVSKSWKNKKGSEIVSELVGMAGLGTSVQSSPMMAGKKVKDDHVKLALDDSAGQTIHKLAQFDGFRWWVKNGTFHYAPIGFTTGSYSVFYQEGEQIVSDCLELQIIENGQAQGGQVKVNSWHPKSKEAFSGDGQISSNAGSGGGQSNYNIHIPNLLQDQAQQWAKSIGKEISRNAITVIAHVIGDPAIDVGGALQVNGTDFAGSYPIDAITHMFGMRGYTMRIVARSGGNEGS